MYFSLVNPCEYSILTIQGFGLRDSDNVKGFGSFIRKKASSFVNSNPVELSRSELIDDFSNEQPMAELNNAIHATM